MNILFLCDEYPPGRHGGIGTAVQLLARQLVKDGHTVVVAGFYGLGYGGDDEYTDEGVRVFRFRTKLNGGFFNNRGSLFVRIAVRLLKMTGILQRDIQNGLQRYKSFLEGIIAKYSIDVVEIPDFMEYYYFCSKVVPFPSLSVPTIVKLHGSVTYFMSEAGEPVPDHIRKMDEMVLNQATAVTSVSDYTARKVAEYFKYTKPIITVYNGINLPEGLTGVGKQSKRVVFSGTLIHKKGIYQLMKAWNTVASQVPDAQLLIFGKGPVDKLKSELEPGATGSVHFKGHVSRQELYDYLASAQVAVFPSYAETFGLGPVEAMSCGTAVIYSTRTSGPEIIEHKVNGLLIDPDNVEELANAIIYLINHPEVAGDFGKKARRTVMEKFDISMVAKANVEIYKSVIR